MIELRPGHPIDPDSDRTELVRQLLDARTYVQALEYQAQGRMWWYPGQPMPADAEANGHTDDIALVWERDVRTAARLEAVKRAARREAEAAELAQATGERRLTSWADLAAQPKPAWILPGVLTAGVYGLAGPAQAGKSLLCRDWCVHLAAAGQPVLYCLSEGYHDLADRWSAAWGIEQAAPRLAFLTEPLRLDSAADVGWLIGQRSGVSGGLVVFDMVYGYGVTDDNTTAGVGPVLAGCKRLAAELSCCVLVTGHPGHGGQRRFRGTSMWRGALDGEFHMAEGRFSCEKHKYTDPRAGQLNWSYLVEYPLLRAVHEFEAAGHRMASRDQLIREDLRLYPGDSIAARARRLGGPLGLDPDYVRRLIRKAGQDDGSNPG